MVLFYMKTIWIYGCFTILRVIVNKQFPGMVMVTRVLREGSKKQLAQCMHMHCLTGACLLGTACYDVLIRRYGYALTWPVGEVC